MTMSDSYSFLCAKIIWKIDNFIYCEECPLDSKKFVIDTLDKSSWYFRYYSDSGATYFKRAEDDNVKQHFTVKIEVAVLNFKNEQHHLRRTLIHKFKDSSVYLSSFFEGPNIPLKLVCENAEKYLHRNTFSLRCKIWLPENKNAIQMTRATVLTGIPMSECIYENINRSLVTTNIYQSSKNTLPKDTLCMYRDGSMSDFTIQVKGRIFPVNAFILASRSPVFHRMLQTNMKEKTEKILKLDELDEDTVGQMLEYMYSDDPGELTTDSALKLYYVGDQYQIVGLKEISGMYIKQNISPTNACNIFQLANQHKDEDLKSLTTQFILLHEKEIVLSEDFETLCKSNKNLCLDILKELTKARLYSD